MLPVNAQKLGKNAKIVYDPDLLETINVSNGRPFLKAVQIIIETGG